MGGGSRGLKGVNWARWKHRFHVDKITVAGHSFGAATVVEVLRNADRFENVQAGIIYDIWGAPIKPPEEDQRHRIHSPLLGINSEAFMYWQTNFDAVMALMNEASEQGAPAFLCTVRGSVHISQSDFSVLYKHACSLFLKATVNPQRAIDLNISASLEFLRDVGAESSGKSIIERCLTDEGLLQLEPLDEVPDDQKPDDEFIAAKLKVPNEFKTRLAASVQRKVRRRKGKGKIHGWYEPGDEMWMHFKPKEDQLRKWQEGKKPVEEHVEEEGGAEPGSGHKSQKQDEAKAASQTGKTLEDTSTNTSQAATSQNTTQDTSQNTSGDDWVGNEGTTSGKKKTDASRETSQRASLGNSEDSLQDSWLGRPPALRGSTYVEDTQ
jgi:platelet-activating factor acetylhydrolase